MLVEWNATQAAVPPLCVHQLFERQAARSPDAVALSADDETITYGELNGRADRLARRLRSLGVGREELVCVCIDRGIPMVIGLLAILKAGGAYVPLDPGYPPDRLAFMLEDSGARVVLSGRATAGRLPLSNATVLLLDDEADCDATGGADSDRSATPDDLCYVVYTSGSTGKPKGVAVPHRGVVNLCTWHSSAFAVSPADRASQVASVAFDACAWELWPYLAVGASVHIIADDVRASPGDLLKAFSRKKITIGFLPTPLAQMVFDEPALFGLKLRYLLTGGDKLTRPPPPGSDFITVNNYGPTEYSVVATSCVLVAARELPPPIGRPIANTQAYILDRHRNPVPIGVEGELYVGGHGLARGYHNRPELTAESFIADPISSSPGARLYRTGDLARYRSDGLIEFLGRKDHQVKIRGFRIELGEIEAALSEHNDVGAAVVNVVPRDHDGDRLVAYVVPRQKTMLTVNGSGHSLWQELTAGLRTHLRARLPDYMLPGDFVGLSQFPLTPNGKVDRRALAEADSACDGQGRAHVAPRTPIEEALAGIWSEILEIDHVGIDDNFFEIGGHSLLAARLISQVRDRLKVEVPLRTLFRSPTPSQFAASLLANAANPAALEKVAELVVSLSNLSDDEVRRMLDVATIEGEVGR